MFISNRKNISFNYNSRAKSFVSSCFNFVLIIQDVNGLSILDLLGSLLKFELKKGVGDNADSNVNGLDVVFDLSDGLLDVLERTVVAERLSGIVNLTLGFRELLVDLHKFGLEILYILGHLLVVILDLLEIVGVGSVVSGHALEASRKYLLLLANLLEGL